MRNLIDDIWPQEGITTILDLGCGDLWFTAGLPGVTKHVGIDIHAPAIEKAKTKNVPGFAGFCMDLREFIRTQAEAGYDAVLAIDVIEHFDEDEARSILANMERVAK